MSYWEERDRLERRRRREQLRRRALEIAVWTGVALLIGLVVVAKIYANWVLWTR